MYRPKGKRKEGGREGKRERENIERLETHKTLLETVQGQVNIGVCKVISTQRVALL